VKLRPFQKEIVRGACGKGIRTALVSMPRGNAKTTLAAMLGLAELFTGPESADPPRGPSARSGTTR
jgi:phage terminase large subunit-like protein